MERRELEKMGKVMPTLEDKLRQAQLKITPQRLEVLRALEKYPTHPCADTLYRAVKRRYPSVSLATVYKTLETLVAVGQVKVALVNKGKAFYDTRVDAHHHFLCTQCGYVEDVDIKLGCLDACAPRGMLEEHHVDHSEVVFHGVCNDCLTRTKRAMS